MFKPKKLAELILLNVANNGGAYMLTSTKCKIGLSIDSKNIQL